MIYVMLPAYNEEKGIGLVLGRLPAIAAEAGEPFRVVVVDDGSRDRTSETAASFGDRLDLKLFRFEQNRGVSEVFKTGLGFVAGDSRDPDRDIAIVLDSDNTQDPRLMLEMIRKVRAGADIVIASRFEPGGGMVGCPLPRRVLSEGVSFLLRLLIRLPGVKDYSTFYRAYRVSVLKAGFEKYGDGLLAGRGFAAIGALLIRLATVSRSVAEVPFVLRYDLKGGQSGIKIWKTMLGYAELIRDFWKTRGFRGPAAPSASRVS